MVHKLSIALFAGTMLLPALRDAAASGLQDLRLRGKPLQPVLGSGQTFSSSHQRAFQNMFSAGSQDAGFPVQWQLMDLEDGQVLSQSAGAGRLFYGASISKVFAAAAFLHRRGAQITGKELSLLAQMLIVSSNRAWGIIQSKTGDGSTYRGQSYQTEFVRRLGLDKTIPFRGWHDNTHGNKVSAAELNRFILKTYKKSWQGSDKLWALMHSCRTLKSRALRWLPADLVVGGKTGTWIGRTVHPQSGKPYNAGIRHLTITFRHEDRQYALTILSDGSRNKDLAIMTGGLYRRFLEKPAPVVTAASDDEVSGEEI